jgi:acyl carrier protein
MTDDILSQIRQLARDRLALTVDVLPESRLIEDLGLDSLRLQALAIEVENHYRIILEPEDEEAILTVSDLVATIDRKLGRP